MCWEGSRIHPCVWNTGEKFKDGVSDISPDCDDINTTSRKIYNKSTKQSRFHQEYYTALCNTAKATVSKVINRDGTVNSGGFQVAQSQLAKMLESFKVTIEKDSVHVFEEEYDQILDDLQRDVINFQVQQLEDLNSFQIKSGNNETIVRQRDAELVHTIQERPHVSILRE